MYVWRHPYTHTQHTSYNYAWTSSLHKSCLRCDCLTCVIEPVQVASREQLGLYCSRAPHCKHRAVVTFLCHFDNFLLPKQLFGCCCTFNLSTVMWTRHCSHFSFTVICLSPSCKLVSSLVLFYLLLYSDTLHRYTLLNPPLPPHSLVYPPPLSPTPCHLPPQSPHIQTSKRCRLDPSSHWESWPTQ